MERLSSVVYTNNAVPTEVRNQGMVGTGLLIIVGMTLECALSRLESIREKSTNTRLNIT